MKKEPFSVIVAGHLDHGKSTLIGRLMLETGSLPRGRIEEIENISGRMKKIPELAFLADQLEEERLGEMTFDTTQVFLKTGERDYILIDSPGHSELIKNMLTGATLAQAALLIIDARRGLEEQTYSHSRLLALLGITEIIVVLNKIETTDYSIDRFRMICAEVEKTFGTLGLKPGLIIPVSAKLGINISRNTHPRMKWYKGPSLLKAIDSLSIVKKTICDRLRFAVQDVYSEGKEKIIAGKILSGTVTKGQKVRTAFSSGQAKVKKIRGFPKDYVKASAGQNPGLVLENNLSVKRGDIITGGKEQIEPTSSFKASVFWFAEKPLLTGKPLLIRCSTQEIKGFARKIGSGADRLPANESATVAFETETPLVLDYSREIPELSRVVIEKDFRTLGLGVIT